MNIFHIDTAQGVLPSMVPSGDESYYRGLGMDGQRSVGFMEPPRHAIPLVLKHDS